MLFDRKYSYLSNDSLDFARVPKSDVTLVFRQFLEIIELIENYSMLIGVCKFVNDLTESVTRKVHGNIFTVERSERRLHDILSNFSVRYTRRAAV